MKLRTIQILKTRKFMVQIRVGVVFRKWVCLNEYGVPIRPDSSAAPITFNDKVEAFEFMETVYHPKPLPTEFIVVGWIGYSNNT